MKWVKASERLPVKDISVDIVGKSKEGRLDLYSWDNQMKFHRPRNHDVDELYEWLDETQPDSLPVAGDGKPFEFIKFPGEKGSEISSHNDETELEHLLLKVKDTSGFDQWLKGKNIELSPEEKKAAIVIFQAGINYAAASHHGSVDAVKEIDIVIDFLRPQMKDGNNIATCISILHNLKLALYAPSQAGTNK